MLRWGLPIVISLGRMCSLVACGGNPETEMMRPYGGAWEEGTRLPGPRYRPIAVANSQTAKGIADARRAAKLAVAAWRQAEQGMRPAKPKSEPSVAHTGSHFPAVAWWQGTMMR